jgi:hypothetical protein
MITRLATNKRACMRLTAPIRLPWTEQLPSPKNGSGFGEIVRANLLEEGEMVRHDPKKLAQAVLGCAAQSLIPLPVAV